MRCLRRRIWRGIIALVGSFLVAFGANRGEKLCDLWNGRMAELQEIIVENKETEGMFLPGETENLTSVYVWWGTIYPKFCFSERKEGKLKISFWVAKAFDWW